MIRTRKAAFGSEIRSAHDGAPRQLHGAAKHARTLKDKWHMSLTLEREAALECDPRCKVKAMPGCKRACCNEGSRRALGKLKRKREAEEAQVEALQTVGRDEGPGTNDESDEEGGGALAATGKGSGGDNLARALSRTYPLRS